MARRRGITISPSNGCKLILRARHDREDTSREVLQAAPTLRADHEAPQAAPGRRTDQGVLEGAPDTLRDQ
jgi:hypothetical protein